MSEDEARSWVETRFGADKTLLLDRFADFVRAEATQQNLVAPSTLDQLWSRHIVDSAQLVALAKCQNAGGWIDVGSGAGFPGIVIASLIPNEVRMIEPRKRRAAFLEGVVRDLGLSNAEVSCRHIEKLVVGTPAGVITARAVSSLDRLFEWAIACSDERTQWILPKGRSARAEVAEARKGWHGTFHVEQSITDPDSLIVLATGVARR